ncbi:MAG: permease [bacterium]
MTEAARLRARSTARGLRIPTVVAAAAAAWLLVFVALGSISAWIARDLLRLSPATRVGRAVEFFVFEAPKVLLLLVAVVFAVGIVRSFFSPERTRAILAGRGRSLGNVLAAALGTVTPFCSCSAVPLFIGFLTAGVPLGVTFSFLVAAPMVNEVALALLFAMFGWRVAALYLSTGLGVAIVAGWVLGRLHMERHVEPWVYGSAPAAASAAPRGGLLAEQPVLAGWASVREIVGRVWPFVLAGIAVGAAIHGYVPEGFLASIMGKAAWWSVPLAVIIGVPMYSNAAGIIPVVHALLEKGAALGTVLAFMMSVIALSLPETIILRKVLKPRLIGVFVGVVAAGIVGVGFLFNWLI